MKRCRGAVCRRTRSPHLLVCAVVAAGLAACGSTSAGGGGSTTVRLGYLPNLTNATAMVAVQKGFFSARLGSGVTLKTQSFNAGPAEVEAIFGGALDAGYFGPNPAINAFVRTHGEKVRVVAGATSGGASLVVRSDSGITSAADLRGKRIATPQLGNTQDVALRTYLAANGLHVNPQGDGDVKILPTDNSTTLTLFKSGKLDGAWVPEPYATRLIDEAGGVLLVDEATLWPGGRLATTLLVVSTDLLRSHRDIVRDLVEGQLDAESYIAEHTDDAQTAVQAQLKTLTQKALSDQVLSDAWSRLTFTHDPIASSLAKEASDAHAAGVVGGADIRGIVDLSVLNEVLRARGETTVDDGGLGSA